MTQYKRLIAALAALILTAGMATGADDNPQPAKRYVIADHGALGDAQTINTKAIQAVIDRAAADGGGVIVVPKGTFLTGAIFLKQGVNLRVEKDGVLKGSANAEDYPTVKTRWEGIEREFTAALLNAVDLNGVELSGEGTIDGSGDLWVENYNRLKQQPQDARRSGYTPTLPPRPRLICFQNCRRVNISGLTLKNQALWCLHILYCEDVIVDGLKIRADHDIPSSDGIDVDSSRKVLITKCDIDVNDDCISIKSGKDADGLRVNRPSEDIVIEKCRFGYGHGGVAMGSEVSGGIRNVEVRDCTAEDDNWEPIRFKSQPSRGGVVENIIYRNIELKNTRNALTFNMQWRMVPPIAPPAKVLTVVRNVKIINVTGTVKSAGSMHGMKDSPIENVKFENCKISAQKGLTLENVKNVDLSGLDLKVEQGEPIIWKGAKPEEAQPAKRYVITDHGAIGDAQTLNTKAIQATIDKCSADGGGVVDVPKGTFITGAIFLKQGVNLQIEKDGTLKGTTEQKEYPVVKTRWEGAETERSAALLNAVDLNGVELTGEGTIDGSGEEWVQLFNETNAQKGIPPKTKVPVPPPGRPKLICFQNCRNVRISDLSLLNPASWGLHILYSEDVVVRNLKSRAAHNIPNSDGIDVDSSRRVLISACDIDSNDDCISIKAGRDAEGLRVNRPSQDIVVEKCRWGYGHGGVAIGSETSGSIRNVEVRDCTAEDGNWAPVRIKSTASRGGVVENIIFKNIKMHDVRRAFEFNLLYSAANAGNPPAKVLVAVRNVQLINISGDAKNAGIMYGLPDSPIRDVRFENCTISTQKGLEVQNVNDVDFSGLKLTVKEGDPIIRKDAKPE